MDLQGLLSNPMFMAGMGILGSEGNVGRGGLLGLQMAQQQRQQIAEAEKERYAMEQLKKKAQMEEMARQAYMIPQEQMGNYPDGSPQMGPPQPARAPGTPTEMMQGSIRAFPHDPGFAKSAADIAKGMAPPKAPDQWRLYNLAQQQGFKGSYMDFKKAQRSPLVKVNQTPRSLQEEMALEDYRSESEFAREYTNKVRTSALESAKILPDLKKGLEVVKKVYTGPGAKPWYNFKKGLEIIGFPVDAEEIGSFEHLETLTASYIKEHYLDTKGPITERENKMFETWSAGPTKTRRGNISIMEWSIAKRQRDIDLSRQIDKWRDQKIPMAQIRRMSQEWVENNDLSNMIQLDDEPAVTPKGDSSGTPSYMQWLE